MGRQRRGRGEGCVYQSPDCLWVATISNVDGSGKRRRSTAYAATKREALEKLRGLRPAGTGCAIDAQRLTVGQYLDAWIDRAAGGLAATTDTRYRQVIRLQIKPFVGSVRLTKLAKVHVS